jgi:hypothetical protein
MEVVYHIICEAILILIVLPNTEIQFGSHVHILPMPKIIFLSVKKFKRKISHVHFIIHIRS